MKFAFGLLLVCVIAIAAVAMWPIGIDLIRPFRSSNGIAPAQPEPLPEASMQVQAKPAPKPSKSRVPEARAVVEPALTREAGPASKTMAAVDPTPAATQSESVVKTYGEPAVSITGIDRGHDVETLVYTRNHGKEVSAISLKDGQISSRSGVTPVVDLAAPRPGEAAAALPARPAEPRQAAIAIPPAAEAPKTSPKAADKTLAAGGGGEIARPTACPKQCGDVRRVPRWKVNCEAVFAGAAKSGRLVGEGRWGRVELNRCPYREMRGAV